MLTKFGEFRPTSAMNSKFGPSTNGVFEQFVDLSLSLEALYPLLVSFFSAHWWRGREVLVSRPRSFAKIRRRV